MDQIYETIMVFGCKNKICLARNFLLLLLMCGRIRVSLAATVSVVPLLAVLFVN